MFTNEQFTDLTKKYIDTVFRVAFGYTKNSSDADDITQNVFLALFREQKDFASEDHIKHWLIRVTVNECRKWFRSPWRTRVSFEEYAQTVSFESKRHSDLFYAVMDLPVKYRMPIYLYYYEAYSTEEIAGILKIPKGTVCTNLKRGRDMLRKTLEEDGQDG